MYVCVHVMCIDFLVAVWKTLVCVHVSKVTALTHMYAVEVDHVTICSLQWCSFDFKISNETLFRYPAPSVIYSFCQDSTKLCDGLTPLPTASC